MVPSTWPASETLKMKPDGVLFSNGPGDPSAVPYAVETVKNILGKVPVFGICMGHQSSGVLLLICHLSIIVGFFVGLF